MRILCSADESVITVKSVWDFFEIPFSPAPVTPLTQCNFDHCPALQKHWWFPPPAEEILYFYLQFSPYFSKFPLISQASPSTQPLPTREGEGYPPRHVKSPGSVVHSEESSVRPHPHAWSLSRPWLVSVTINEREYATPPTLRAWIILLS